MERICKHGFVAGIVQGVGFRAFTRQRAIQHQVTGWARNLSDGRVEFTLCGQKDTVALVESAIKQGPQWAQVDSFTSATIDEQTFSSFSTS